MADAAISAPPAPAEPAVAAAVQEKTPVSGSGSGSSSDSAKLPLPFPTPSSKPKERAPLTADQQAKYDWLLSRVKEWKNIPPSSSKVTGHGGPLGETERMWLTRECLLRYLRATKWHQKDAERRLLETLAWRREYGVDTVLTAEHISPENETGKQLMLGYDIEARVCHYLNPARQNTEPSPRQVQHLVYMIERALDLMPPRQETFALLINFKASKNRSNTAPGIGIARETLHILQSHYPERLGRSLVINVPWVVWGFFKLITPFIDPLTREKLKFNEDLRQHVPPEQLWTEYGGDLTFDYDHAVYWPGLEALCAERRAERVRRWEAGGRQVGEHEPFLDGVEDVGVAGTTVVEKAEAKEEIIADAGADADANADTDANADVANGDGEKEAATTTEAA